MRHIGNLDAVVASAKRVRREATHRITIRLNPDIEGFAALAKWREGTMAKHVGLVICLEDLAHKPGEIDLLLGVRWSRKAHV